MTTLADRPLSDAPDAAPPRAWDEPDGVAARGTLVVLTGRGESAAAYGRFGRRLAADAYRVRVVELRLDDLEATRAEVVDLLADPSLPAPRVLVGADAGATYAAALAVEGLAGVDALVLAGVAVPGPLPADGWEQELEARSACPAHRRVLSEDPAFRRGSLVDALPAAWTGALDATTGLPTLVVHGSEDPVTPVQDVLDRLDDDRPVEVAVVEGGRHDVLNDVTHRSVAATVVLFLERLRLGPDLPVLVHTPRGA